MSDKLKDRIAVITGSDSGIGQAMAQVFAEEGADVIITYLHDRDGAERTRRQVEANRRRAVVMQLDQRDPEQVERLFREAAERLGTPDILVNNAAVNASGKEVADMSIEDWDNELKTDLYGPFYCCRQFIRLRRANGGRGKIINITSVHEKIPMTGAAAYDAAKGGLRNLTRTLALELARDHINVNNIAPGMVLTPMNQEAIDDPDLRENEASNIPWKRPAEPLEVARLGVYLASEDSDYATGQTFTLDGGLTMSVGQGA